MSSCWGAPCFTGAPVCSSKPLLLAFLTARPNWQMAQGPQQQWHTQRFEQSSMPPRRWLMLVALLEVQRGSQHGIIVSKHWGTQPPSPASLMIWPQEQAGQKHVYKQMEVSEVQAKSPPPSSSIMSAACAVSRVAGSNASNHSPFAIVNNRPVCSG